MSKEWHQRSKFITLERPLLPNPPDEAVEYGWFYVNRLIFYDAHGVKVWEQDIPEAELSWLPHDNGGDEFGKYFERFEVFKDDRFGWQLRMMLSHAKANYWAERIYKEMVEYIEQHHREHFAMKSCPR